MGMPSNSLIKRFLLIFCIPAVLLIVLLVLGLKDFVRDAIILPLAYTWQLVSLLYQSTPQVLFWGIFLVVSFVILIKVFGSVKNTAPVMPVHQESESMAPARDRIYYWTVQVQLALHGNLYFRDKVMRSIEKIVLGVIAYQERLTLKEVEYAINHHGLSVPDDIATLFKNREEDFYASYSSSFTERLLRWLRRMAESIRQVTTRKVYSSEQQQLEAIIEYLDKQLEIKHGA